MKKPPTKPKRTREECEAWLRDLLGKGSHYIWHIRVLAFKEGFSLSQLEWAKMRVRVVTTWAIESYSWKLPED